MRCLTCGGKLEDAQRTVEIVVGAIRVRMEKAPVKWCPVCKEQFTPAALLEYLEEEAERFSEQDVPPRARSIVEHAETVVAL